MKTLFVAAIMAVASPAFAQSAEPTCPHCEQAEMGCCEKDQDGKMRCKMMDHAEVDHGSMDHSKMQHGQTDHGVVDHASMDHGAMNPGDHAAHSANTPD
ncbi:hypothetical protein [Porphyrobacter sp. GA68]|uniref:hypothetical protein n=1 Tax=Porphyrobacter sp. GA68 TaxID=2883480 RepID=UPI00240D967C|nr:hypothetical protein [Porphyrobacter sp. GA68]